MVSFLAKLAGKAPQLTRASGILLILLGVIHLIATPFYMAWCKGALLPRSAELVSAGLRLNHILVGILLIPIGLCGYWAGQAMQETWAIRIAVMNALVLLCLPVLLILIMPLSSLDAPLFRLAILVLCLACLTQGGALAGVWAARNKNRSSPSIST